MVISSHLIKSYARKRTLLTNHPMPILVYGLNYRTADIDDRGQLAFSAEDIPRALQSLRDTVSGLTEAVILSTCNRSEIHCALDSKSSLHVRRWLAQDRDYSSELIQANAYEYWDDRAVQHAIETAAGLDSQVLGETQIFGQFKDAYEESQKLGHLGRELQLVEATAIHSAKKIRSSTDIGRNPVSVSYAAVKMIKQVFTSLEDISVLVIGAGDNVRLLMEHLVSNGVRKLTIANRTIENAQELAANFGANTVSLDSMPGQLASYDVVMSSTGSPEPILGKSDFTQAITERRRKPMLVVDLAVPRDINSDVSELTDVYLYTVDDLTGIIKENLKQRETAAEDAKLLVQAGLERFKKENQILRIAPLLREYRTQNEQTRAELLKGALIKLNQGQDAEAVVERLTKDLTNQLSHKPTLLLRYLAGVHTNQQLKAIQQLFDEDEN